ncbi:acyl-CoA thioesterase [Halorubrum sp. DTA46]|uniref:acyl-CoA thioesterase n=1 Tax=Halorubrum sp. DTA46 TaxID=3402162 RepID=UPI003AAB7FCA
MSTYTTEIDVRFRDIDAMGHVNNAVYATYVEQARSEYYRDVLDADLARVSTVLASLSLDFRRPVELTDGTVTATVDVDAVGRSSVSMSHEIRVGAGGTDADESGETAGDETTVAEATATLVTIDPDSGEPRPVPEAFRTAITEFHEL